MTSIHPPKDVLDAIETLSTFVTSLVNASEDIGKAKVADQIREFIKIRDVHDAVYGVKKELHKLNEFYKNVRIPKTFDQEDIRNFTIDEGFQITLSPQMRVKTLDMEEAIDWVTGNVEGGEELVIRTINASTLKSLATELAENGKELPDDVFEVDIYSAASIRKATKKKS